MLSKLWAYLRPIYNYFKCIVCAILNKKTCDCKQCECDD